MVDERDERGRNAATAATEDAQADARGRLPSDVADTARTGRSRIAAPAGPAILAAAGYPVWDHEAYRFLDDEPPPTVHPNLWRHARLNGHAGLFEVVDGCWQVRGHDLANVTFVRGATGWIVIDPLTSAETARAARALADDSLGARPVTAVIYTHSHVDHFGGILGVVDEDDVTSGRVPVIAPEGFLEAAVGENVIAGAAMLRRASYMYGALLPRDGRGHVDAGLGRGIPLLASSALVAPTVDVSATGTVLEVDGVTVEFQVTPDTEAPAEMNFFFPALALLCMAENCAGTMHNVYTPRGALVRDALGWSKYLHEAITLFGGRCDAMFTSHHWPHWGRADVVEHLEVQRDLYRYVHDQTMRLANQGYTMIEIAEMLRLPPSLAAVRSTGGFYGTINHNAKAVYQRYLGWFDGNPAHLHPLPPAEAGARYVEFMGGPDVLLANARRAYDEGDYRWVAQVVDHLVFAQPENEAARALQADTLEQLGYQAESAPWRDFYLTGAQELRQGPAALGRGVGANPAFVRAMSPPMLLDLIGVRLDGPRADGRRLRIDLTVTQSPGSGGAAPYACGLDHGALHYRNGSWPDDEGAQAVVCTHAALASLAAGASDLGALVAGGSIRLGEPVEADLGPLGELVSLLDTFDLGFAIVTP